MTIEQVREIMEGRKILVSYQLPKMTEVHSRELRVGKVVKLLDSGAHGRCVQFFDSEHQNRVVALTDIKVFGRRAS